MTEESQDAKPENPEHDQWSTIELGWLARSTCGVLGVASTVYAAVVLWQGKEGAATVAFVVLGAILIILGLTGVMPRRIKSGGHEIELLRQQVKEDTRQTTDNALATMTRTEIEDFIEETLRLRGSDTSDQKYIAATRAQEALDFERRTYQMIVSALPDLIDGGESTQADISTSIGSNALRIIVKWKLAKNSLAQVMSWSREDPDIVYWVVTNMSPQDLAWVNATLRHPSNYPIRGKLLVSPGHYDTIQGVTRWLVDKATSPPPAGVISTF